MATTDLNDATLSAKQRDSATPMTLNGERQPRTTTRQLVGARAARNRARFQASLAAFLAVSFLCASCSSSGSHSANAAPGTTNTSTPQGVSGTGDACIVGTWTSTMLTIPTTTPDGIVALSGGTGEVITIEASGSFTDDWSHASALNGNSNGHRYDAKASGTATGNVTTSNGFLIQTVPNPQTVTVTVSEDGTPFASAHEGTDSQAYVCSSNTLTLKDAAAGQLAVYKK